MLGLTFQPATQADIPVIFSFAKELIDTYEDKKQIPYDQVLSWVRRKIEQNISQYTCVYCAQEKAAYFRFYRTQDGWELDDFYVQEHLRGRGIGTKVLENCLQAADGPVSLCVFRKNTGAIRLYERMGFAVKKIVSDTRMILRTGG